MKLKFLRCCGSLALVLLVSALPLWVLWRRGASARQEGLELAARSRDARKRDVREKQGVAARRFAELESASARLSSGAFLEWEAFCKEQPWSALRPLLERRLAQVSGEDAVRTLLLIRWAEEDGAEAAAWALEHAPQQGGQRPGADAKSVGATWAWHDPAGFVSAIQKAKEAGQPEWLGSSCDYCWWLAGRDVALAFQVFRQPYNPTTDWTCQVADLIAPYLKTTGEAKALVELVQKEKHAEYDLPVNYITRILRAWADMDEAGALAAADSYPGHDSLLKAQVVNYVMRGKPETEATADEWLERLPEQERRQSTPAIVKALMSTDAAAAERWMLKQGSAINGEAVRQYLHDVAFREPPAALAFAESLPDAAQRTRSVSQVVADWAGNAPGGTTELLRSHGWREAQITQLKDRMAVTHPETVRWWWDW